MALKKGAHIYFMGIGGTGMASVAGLFKDAGFKISGSDKGVYPPMSEMLADLAIPYKTPYASSNISSEKPDMVVVANALSRGNEELEYMLSHNMAYKSFPDLLGEEILAQRETIVVAGTHGKTTTTSICSYVLQKLGEEPGYLIGGIPRDFTLSFDLGKGPWFVIEGDEYDTAFFDKGPKFLHYRPKYAILNNLEFDHADIYQSLEQIETQFAKFAALLTNPKHIIANIDDPGIARLLEKTGLTNKVTRVSTLGKTADADLVVKNLSCRAGDAAEGIWSAQLVSKTLGNVEVETTLSGTHNMANVGQVVALLALLNAEGRLKRPLDLPTMKKALRSFQGVKRRLDLLGQGRGIEVYEDFAHHPTAISLVIEGFRKMHPGKRLTVAFEPANATGRRNVLQNDFAKALAHADRVLIGKCPVDQRIPEQDRMNTTALAEQIGGGKGMAFKENEDLLAYLKQNLKQGDAVIFMSSSSFSGIQHQLAKSLK